MAGRVHDRGRPGGTERLSDTEEEGARWVGLGVQGSRRMTPRQILAWHLGAGDAHT